MPKLHEKPSALEREHPVPVLKNMKILDFVLFLWVIFALLDPGPDPQFECGSGSSSSINADPWIRIWIRNPVSNNSLGQIVTSYLGMKCTKPGRYLPY
jgi:hypothetical protein